jgi:protein SCO1/2
VPALGRADDDGFRALRVIDPYEIPGLILTGMDGQPYDLRAETDGRIALLYVGYTNCPDICPTHLAAISAALERVPPEVAQSVTVLFITADPERDTPEMLRTYLAAFNEDFIGLTGEIETLARLQDALRMNRAEKDEGGEALEGYAVLHAAYVIAFSEDGRGHLAFPAGLSVDDWTHDLTKLVREGAGG